MSKFNGPRKSSSLGDLQIKEVRNAQTGQFEPDLYEVRDKSGNPTGEYVQRYSIRVYIDDSVDEAQCGSPSIVLKKDQFIDARGLTEEEKGRLPDFLKNADGSSKVACKLSIQLGDRKQYPKKPRS
jgi:hypothetical protein